jgi:Serine/threonine protein phosphatase
VTAANNAIFDAREADPEHAQMSCVLTAAIIDVEQRQISMAHVGDSRLYSYHHEELKKLSHDHSLVGYREEIGDLTEEEAMHHPQRNVIGRDVGSQKHKANDDDFIEAQVFPLLPSTTLLLCSDGLTDMITSSTIITVLSKEANLEEKANSLIKAALDAGGKAMLLLFCLNIAMM